MFIKKILCATLISSCLISTSYADFSELVLDNTKSAFKNLSFSDKFIKSLASCTPYKENREENGINITYELKGYNANQECQLSSKATHAGMEVLTQCLFSPLDLEIYVESLQNLQNLIANATSVEEIMSNDDYLAAVGMQLDPDICKSFRSAYDPTKEIRKHLKDCTPYKEQINVLEKNNVTMEILGKQGETCRYIYQVQIKAPSQKDMEKLLGKDGYQKMKEFIKDQTATTECKFSPSSVKRYIKLLEETAIPAGDAHDTDIQFKSMEKQQEAQNFLLSNQECQSSIN